MEAYQLHAAVRRTIGNTVSGMCAEEPTREKTGGTYDAQVTFDAEPKENGVGWLQMVMDVNSTLGRTSTRRARPFP